MSDLFAFAATAAPVSAPRAAPAPSPVEVYPPAPNMDWARRLTAVGPIETQLMVAIRWTGVVVEVLALGTQGRWFLYADGKVQEVKADPAARHRMVFMGAQALWELHRRRPVIAITVGTHAVTYRFAKPCEEAQAEPVMPRGES